MSARVLGIELRRSIAPLTAVVVLGLGVAVVQLMFREGPTFAQWTTFSGMQRYALEFLVPVALGAGAWQGRRERRSGMSELTSTVSRPAWQRFLPVSGAMAIAVVAGYLVVLAVGAVQVVGNATYHHLGWLPIPLVGALALVAASWLGLGIGTLLPSTLTAPVLTVGALMGLIALRVNGTGKEVLLGPELNGLVDTFTVPAPRVTIAQVIWFAAVAVAGIVLATAPGRRRLLAVLPIAAGLAVALPLIPATQDTRYVADAAAAEPVCTSDAPRVCVTKAHANALGDLTGPARDALRLLAPLAAAPASVAESPRDKLLDRPVKPQPSDVDLIQLWSYDLDDQSHPKKAGEELTIELLRGAGTTQCDYLPSMANGVELERYHRARDARDLAAAMLVGKPLTTFGSLAKQEWPTLHALPADEQLRRVSAFRVASLSCEGDLVDILTHGGAR
ncbi:hypothetical protein ACFWY9_14085 [Amycolatopsis sp. NPDC059027]|uniref:hypothetical protein n=1 Tax=Amycolatopsis sp. NPDC059027 TaxID=3346709 RepID=UPI00366D2912